MDITDPLMKISVRNYFLQRKIESPEGTIYMWDSSQTLLSHSMTIKDNMADVAKTTPTTSEALFQPRMTPNIPGKLNYKRTFLIGLAFLTSQTAWAYYNFMMPLIIRNYVQDFSFGLVGVDTLVGLVMVLDNFVAVMMLPYFGVLSDRTQSRFGKRMPYILIGAISGAIAFSFIPHVKIFTWLIINILWFNLSMAFYRSCSVSLMPDLTDPKVRSTGNAIINIMGALAMVIGLASATVTQFFFDVSTDAGRTAARIAGFHYVSIVMLVALVVLFFTIRETPTGTSFLKLAKNPIVVDPITFEYQGEMTWVGEGEKKKESKFEYLKIVFSTKNKSALFLLLVIFASSFGMNAIETYYSSFATLYLGWDDSKAGMALIMAPISLVITAVPIGKLSDRIGRKKAMFVGLLGLCIGVEVLHYLDRVILDPQGLYVGNLVVIFIVGIFYGLIAVNGIVMVWQLTPHDKIGAFTGVYYLFSQSAAILSPVVAGLEFDLYSTWNPEAIAKYGEGYQYRMLFAFIYMWQLIALFFLSRVKMQGKELSDEELDDLRTKYADAD